MIPFLPAFIVAVLVTCLVIPFTIWFAKRAGLMDDPATHKHPAIIHKLPTPRGGGLPIYIGILIATLIFIPLSTTLSWFLIAGLLVVFIGLLDDKYDISPYIRFLGNIGSSAIVVFAGASLPFITNPLGGILRFDTYFLTLGNFEITLAHILAILWITWVMNMLNWSKGVDGQMPGIAAISAFIIGMASLRFGAEGAQAAELSFIVSGAAVAFLFFNFYPAKIFPGYSATILGFALGVLSIISGVKLATALLVMGVPTADALITIVRRLAAKKSPFWHDRGHLHHLLLQRGYSQRKIAAFYWLMSSFLGLAALNLSSRGKAFAIMTVVVLVAGVVWSMRFLTKSDEV